jgi:hypothetical protein
MIVIVIILSIVLRRRRSLRVILLQVREKMVLTWLDPILPGGG